eukprot:651965-Pleurochrysis_carterae.AAC.3
MTNCDRPFEATANWARRQSWRAPPATQQRRVGAAQWGRRCAHVLPCLHGRTERAALNVLISSPCTGGVSGLEKCAGIR